MPETQKQVGTAIQASGVSVGVVETPTEDFAYLGDKATSGLEKTPVTEVTTGEKSSRKTSTTNTASLPSLSTTPVEDNMTPVKA